ncbi:MAG: 3-deoxy-manno-octulosonate cytidylyltransferase [Flavobacteriales bacterium]|nr:3-deoxy-manno-octulosonate cytidylyltransferase [Flavobacteriales bacterium]
MNVLAVIPARYASTRFPGKPLAQIHGKPMIQVVYERVAACPSIDALCVATDDERIIQAVQSFGGQVLMTSDTHRSGTDRIAEAVQTLNGDFDLILNVQGDEPGIRSEDLEALIGIFANEIVDIGTLVTPFTNMEDFQNPDRVKAVLSHSGQALYFTRAAAPFHRGEGDPLSQCYQHVGVYAYRADVLPDLGRLEPSPLELKESLEQLRWLENDYVIHARVIEKAPFGIDTPDDLEKFVSEVH